MMRKNLRILSTSTKFPAGRRLLPAYNFRPQCLYR